MIETAEIAIASQSWVMGVRPKGCTNTRPLSALGSESAPKSCCRVLRGIRAIRRHEAADLRLGLRPQSPAVGMLLDERFVVHRQLAELPDRKAVSLTERIDVGEQCGGHALTNKVGCVQPSSRLYPRFIAPPDTTIIALMADSPGIETIRANLRRIMAKKGVRPTTLSQRVGNSKTLVSDLLTKVSDVQFGTLTKLAGALNVELGDLLALPRVPIVGKIGAGGSVIFLPLSDEDQFEPEETVLRPPGISGKLVALVVEGSSMLPKYRDGDIIYIQRNHSGVLEDDIGDDCAVRLVGGETFIKQLVRGSEAGRFTLRSLNAPDMENVEVEWATRVLFIMPRRSREMLDR